MSSVTTAKLTELAFFELVFCACLLVRGVVTVFTLCALKENVSFFVLHY